MSNEDGASSKNPIVKLLTAAGRNGPVGGSYRLITTAFGVTLSITSILGVQVLSQYNERQHDILDISRRNEQHIGDLDALVKAKSDERDRQISELVGAINVLRATIGDLDRRETAIEAQLRWRGPPQQ